MRSVLLAVVAAASSVAYAKAWKPHPIHVIPGKPLKPEDIKPYVPPHLQDAPPLEPSDVKVVEVTAPEALIEMRPWTSPLVGNAVKGARLPVQGVVHTQHGGCPGHMWYALSPFGWLCGHDARPTTEPATTESVLHVREGSRLPFQYVMVLVKEGDKVPMWASLQDLKKGAEPERQLERGDTVAVEKAYTWQGTRYWINVDGKVIPAKGTGMMGGGAEWHGLELGDATPLPFGWVTPPHARVYATPPVDRSVKPIADFALERRTRVNIVGEELVRRRKYLKVTIAAPPPPPTYGDIMASAAKRKPAPAPVATAAVPDAGAPAAPPPPPEMWVSADAINEVRKLDRPKTVPANVDKWIDVDLGEQVLVTYEGDKPTFATLVSSGRAIATPMGTYPVWAKVSSITMKNQPYEDKEYFVNKVPWSTFFQWHNAIHGAYWHDRFGVTKSHGCVNVAPLDAKRIFEWVSPPLPPGWTGLRPLDLLTSPYVVVRNSHMRRQFRQDRPIGPPDRSLEAERLEEAEAARAAAEAQATPGAPGTPAAPGTTPAPPGTPAAPGAPGAPTPATPTATPPAPPPQSAPPPETPSVAAPNAGPPVKP